MANVSRWGVLSSSKFFLTKVLPAVRNCTRTEIVAIASRDQEKAYRLAQEHGIARAYGSYEALLADPHVDIIYNPTPNYLHVPLSIDALRAGKHVLCEKPIALSTSELDRLIEVQNQTGLRAGEAFMVATHPQWIQVRDWVKQGKIGTLRTIQGFFSYMNVDSANIRNRPETGGGAMMDIGCYPLFTARFVSGKEPRRVLGLMERDPDFQTDRLTSAVLDFDALQASFTVSTQLIPYQRMHFFGTDGHIEVEIPFNAPPDKPCRIFLNDEVHELPVADQYTIEFDAFSEAVQEGREVPVTLAVARGNMKAIEAIFQSAASGQWVTL